MHRGLGPAAGRAALGGLPTLHLRPAGAHMHVASVPYGPSKTLDVLRRICLAFVISGKLSMAAQYMQFCHVVVLTALGSSLSLQKDKPRAVNADWWCLVVPQIPANIICGIVSCSTCIGPALWAACRPYGPPRLPAFFFQTHILSAGGACCAADCPAWYGALLCELRPGSVLLLGFGTHLAVMFTS